ncbi:hypothetical protein U0070_015081 [Myodes glareolus]|uniref:Uncharacterized protein n=1 Tax=Myodes glareolus TaxID=447135 RepID=A0AAW0JZ96_MYOGA
MIVFRTGSRWYHDFVYSKLWKKILTLSALRLKTRLVLSFPPASTTRGLGGGVRCRRGRCTYHDCGRGRGCLGGYRGLVGLVLRGFDFGLQMVPLTA